jgi:aryl-alcohol dehydrogenase-like predicted oxidoreductase
MSNQDAREPARRGFFQAAGIAAGVALGLHASTSRSSAQPEKTIDPTRPPPAKGDAIPMRPFGNKEVRVSALGLGGHHLGELKTVEQAIALVHEAIDGGITFFDNCWEYFNGRTENWMGRALKGRRDRVFLMTKVCTHGRGADMALRMLDESLRRLGTDHLDLWQIHGVSFDNDPELAYAKGGVLEALDQAKKQGKTRFVGFTGHKDPGIHLEMISRGYPFDAVQMPLNPLDANYRSFARHVLPEVNRRGMAALGMKPMAGTADAVKSGLLQAEDMLRYAMSLPVTTTIAGMDSLEVLRQNLRVARGFTPLTDEQMQAIRDRCAPFAADGRFEFYKTSLRYDNPQARLAHDFPLDGTQKEVKEMFKEAGSP